MAHVLVFIQSHSPKCIMGILYFWGYIIWTLTYHRGIVGIHERSRYSPVSCVATKWENLHTSVLSNDCAVSVWFVFICSVIVFSVILHSSWRAALRAQLPRDRIPFLRPAVWSGHWWDAVWTEPDGHLRGRDVSGECIWMSFTSRSVI